MKSDEVLRMTIAGLILESRSLLDPHFQNGTTCRMNQKSHEPVSNCVAKPEKFNYTVPFALLVSGIYCTDWTCDRVFIIGRGERS